MRGETTTAGLNVACIEGLDPFALGEVPVGNGRDEWSVVQARSDSTPPETPAP